MRGVNKIVLELRPDDERFEKAILFLNPEKTFSAQKELSDRAEHLLSSVDLRNYPGKRKFFSPPVLILTGIAAGSAATWSIIYLISLIG